MFRAVLALCGLSIILSCSERAHANILFPPNVFLDGDATIDAASSYPEPPYPEPPLSMQILDGPGGPTTVHLVEGGVIGGFVEVIGASHLVMSGGQIQARTEIKDHATLTIRGGSIEPLIGFYDAALPTTVLSLQDAAILNLRGGLLGINHIVQSDSSIIHVYGHSFEVVGELPLGTDPSDPNSGVLVSGKFANNQSLDISIGRRSLTAQVFLHEVPEPPGTTLTMIAAAIALRVGRIGHRRSGIAKSYRFSI